MHLETWVASGRIFGIHDLELDARQGTDPTFLAECYMVTEQLVYSFVVSEQDQLMCPCVNSLVPKSNFLKDSVRWCNHYKFLLSVNICKHRQWQTEINEKFNRILKSNSIQCFHHHQQTPIRPSLETSDSTDPCFTTPRQWKPHINNAKTASIAGVKCEQKIVKRAPSVSF